MKYHAAPLFIAMASFAVPVVGCGSSDPTGSGGEGDLSFTTWGEEYIEKEIPTDPEGQSGFVDGWTVHYQKFLVNFQNIEVADAKGKPAASMKGSKLFDNTAAGVKSIIDFKGLSARAYPRVSYEIAPVADDTEIDDSASEADKQMMIDGGFSVYVEATAEKDDEQKRFAWGFALATSYQECHSEQDGKDQAGIVVTNNSTAKVQLTIHGDHLYYDRLQASPNPAVPTRLRFEPIAEADADDNGEITLGELGDTTLDVRLYDPSGLGAATLGDFVKALARTIGHFRGEGECTVSAL